MMMAHHACVRLKMTFVLLQLFIRCHSLTKPSAVKLEDNGYTGIVLAIHHREPESERLIEEIIVSKFIKLFKVLLLMNPT